MAAEPVQENSSSPDLNLKLKSEKLNKINPGEI